VSNAVTHLRSVICHDDKAQYQVCSDVKCTAGLSRDQMIVEYTDNEYCDMLFTLGTSRSQAGTDARGFTLHIIYIIVVDLIQTLIHFDDCNTLRLEV
jgi:hypothetical protein